MTSLSKVASFLKDSSDLDSCTSVEAFRDDLRDSVFFLIVTDFALEKVFVMPPKVTVIGLRESFAMTSISKVSVFKRIESCVVCLMIVLVSVLIDSWDSVLSTYFFTEQETSSKLNNSILNDCIYSLPILPHL